MASRSVRELAQALPEGERRALLSRIQKSLQLDSPGQESIYHSRNNAEEIHARIKVEIQRLGLWKRILLFFRRLFSGKSEEELYRRSKMEKMVNSLRNSGKPLVRMEGRWLEPEFARLSYELYLSLLPLLTIFRQFWKNPELLQGLVEYILDKKVPNAKSSIFRFLSFPLLQELFEKHESKESLKRELIKQIDIYLSQIPREVFIEIEEGIYPLYYYKELVLFDFSTYFKAFQADLSQLSLGTAEFHPARVEALLNSMEHLYYAVFAARRAKGAAALHEEVFEYFSAINEAESRGVLPDSIRDLKNIGSVRSEHPDVSEGDGASQVLPPPEGEGEGRSVSAGQTGEDKEAKGTKDVRSDASLLSLGQKKVFRSLSDAVEQFWDRSQLGTIIRVFRDNPYYRFLAYAPKLNLFEFYQSALRLKVLSELDDQFPNIRREVIRSRKKKVLPGAMKDFEFYRRSVISSSSVKLPVFRYVDSLLSLYQFLEYRIEREFLETLRLLGRILPERYRDSSSRMVLSIAAFEDLLEAVRTFDYNFSPLSDEGKSFYRLRYAAEKDISQLKAYRVVVSQKDKEVRSFIDRGLELFRGTEKTLSQIPENQLEVLNERFQSISSTGTGSLSRRVKEMISDMGSIQKIILWEQQLEEEIML